MLCCQIQMLETKAINLGVDHSVLILGLEKCPSVRASLQN